jgi:hypothetical protein
LAAREEYKSKGGTGERKEEEGRDRAIQRQSVEKGDSERASTDWGSAVDHMKP